MILHPNVKINLGLSVLRKRKDGFHDIETLFLPYPEIHDTLEIISGEDYSHTSTHIFSTYSPEETAQGISEDGKVMITLARKDGVDWDPLKDLCVKAYELLSEDFKMGPVKIFLEKTSPVGAGLGGGSSDCAAALKMYNEIFSLGLSGESLMRYAARLGSDCAFFIANKPMFGTGKGEVLSEYENPIPQGYEIKVIVPEGVAVSTVDAYKGIKPSENRAHTLKEALGSDITRWKDLIVNDFETTVFAKYPILAKIKQSLYDSGAIYASMSGSGSALYGIYRKDEEDSFVTAFI